MKQHHESRLTKLHDHHQIKILTTLNSCMRKDGPRALLKPLPICLPGHSGQKKNQPNGPPQTSSICPDYPDHPKPSPYVEMKKREDIKEEEEEKEGRYNLYLDVQMEKMDLEKEKVRERLLLERERDGDREDEGVGANGA